MKTLRAFQERELLSGSLIKVSNKHMKDSLQGILHWGFNHFFMQQITGTSLGLQFWCGSYGFRCGMTFSLVQRPNLSPKVHKQQKLLALVSFCIVLGVNIDEFFVTAKRGPLRDADCYWDYGKACCAWQEYCEYRFHSLLFHPKFRLCYSEICNTDFGCCIIVKPNADTVSGMFT